MSEYSDQEIRTLVILAVVLLTQCPRPAERRTRSRSAVSQLENRSYRSDRFSHRRCLQRSRRFDASEVADRR